MKDPKLTVYEGSVTNQEDVDKVFAENNIKSVIIALGGRSKDVGATMLEKGTRYFVRRRQCWFAADSRIYYCIPSTIL